MNVQRDPDAVLAAWLEEGPYRLPEQTRRAISFTTRTTQQKRRSPWAPWRTPLMPTFARIALATVAVIAMVGGAAYFIGPQQRAGGPSPSSSPAVSAAPSSAAPSPAAQATGSTDWTHYTSTRFAYSADYPAAWGVTPATYDWPSIGIPDHDGVSVDDFGTSRLGIQLTVSSVLLKTDAETAARTTEIDSLNQAFCIQLSDRHSITVDGTTLRQEDQLCGDMVNIEVVGSARGRFYQINFGQTTTPLTATDRATFDRFLASFRFGG